ncbi:cytochrome c biogenesis protein CcmA [Pasteurella canis]|uniref:Cytochrome c biogenesis protein CcmA n=1 Tax=Pasteurella canis TaxID=753 RepID=A0A379EVP4_9PAST|nr:AAA family ATPase [Pasteurella canis]SUC10273.1 cytochrome c biogenesis protein CcmA [Pasteurella canis]
MNFQIIKNKKIPININNVIFLTQSDWDDYGYKTTFFLSFIDKSGKNHSIGNIKIAYKGQNSGYTSSKLSNNFFKKLPDNFFSLGQDIDFYRNLWSLDRNVGLFVLEGLNDIAYNISLFEKFSSENVLNTSLMRTIRDITLKEQFSRVFANKSPLTEYNFYFVRKSQQNVGKIILSFLVDPEKKPATNIHAIIGRNGVGKTTILNGMINSFITKDKSDNGDFCCSSPYQISDKDEKYQKISNDYFSYLIAVSFSIFDPFLSESKPDENYYYIGLKDGANKLKDIDKYFQNDFIDSFEVCYSFEEKKERWITAIKNLESDDNFAAMNLCALIDEPWNEDKIISTIKNMSSGHASILLIITQLVAKVEEKTLVLLDEPESHLHPPLLSAFIRALSNLLDNRNGVAIIATHSPIVLQEVPSSCVWKIERTGKATNAFRPAIETFGENVGILTREVFGLEVTNSGFHRLIASSVNKGESYDSIMQSYNNQLGSEGKILLKTLIRLRESKG